MLKPQKSFDQMAVDELGGVLEFVTLRGIQHGREGRKPMADRELWALMPMAYGGSPSQIRSIMQIYLGAYAVASKSR